jgi:hypothetical protein
MRTMERQLIGVKSSCEYRSFVFAINHIHGEIVHNDVSKNLEALRLQFSCEKR